MKHLISAGLFSALVIGGCVAAPVEPAQSTPQEAQMATITGTAGYRERIALLPGAVMRVTLNDISRADAPADVLAEQVIALTGKSVPVDYALTVDPAELQPNMRYSVRAEIRSGDGALLWTTDTAHLIDPQAMDQALEPITLVKVAKPKPAPAPVTLTGTNWRVEDIDGAGVIDNSNTTLMFSTDGRVNGIAGCNTYTGTYTRDGDSLSFGPLAVTRKACVPALNDQEVKFLALIEGVTQVDIAETGILTLTTADGRTLRAAS